MLADTEKADLQQFTPEQITGHCKYLDGSIRLLRDSVQIIRQLQSELAEAGIQSQEDRDYATATSVRAFVPIKINIPTIELQEDERPRLVEDE